MAESSKKLTPIGGKISTIKAENDINNLSYGRLQPQSIPMEEAILGAIMLDKDGLSSVIEILRKESFYLPAHQEIYATMLELFASSRAIDLLTVHEALKKKLKLEEIGGVAYLMHLTNKVASAANIEFHARIVAEKYIQRELIRVSAGIIQDSYEDSKDILELLDEAERSLFDITDQNMNTGYKALSALAAEAKKEIEASSQKESGMTGVTTGFTELNKITSGWQPSDLIIIAARPGMGKTAFTLSLAKNAAEDGSAVAVFSLEMASVQLVQRLISMDAEISGTKLRNGQMDDVEWRKLDNAVNKLSELPIYIDDTPGINIFELRAKCRRLKQNHDIQMIVIDYLQLMAGAPNDKRGNREQEISSISRALKGLAKELKVPVIALSQLSRSVETRGGEKRPMLSDLRESGAIEQDADIVTFIYRPDYYGVGSDDFDTPSDMSEIIISKHRNGSLGTVQLRFRGEFVKFENPGDTGFTNDFTKQDSYNPQIMTRPSKMNTDSDFTGFEESPF